jgi:hypothetical protein
VHSVHAAVHAEGEGGKARSGHVVGRMRGRECLVRNERVSCGDGGQIAGPKKEVVGAMSWPCWWRIREYSKHGAIRERSTLSSYAK